MGARLCRSRTDRMIGGVCGGLGQYLGIDSVLVRLFFVLLAFGTGVGVLLYLLCWIIIPYEGQGKIGSPTAVSAGADEIAERVRAMGEDVQAAARTPHPQAGVMIGLALVVLGTIFLAQNILDALNIVWLSWLDFGTLWPLLLIVGGIALLLRRNTRDPET